MMWFVFGLFLGLIIASVFVFFVLDQKYKILSQQNTDLKTENDQLKESEKSLIESKSRLEAEQDSKQREIENAQKQLEEMGKTLKLEFENAANKILKQNTEDLQKNSKTSLETIINPLKENLESFKKSITDFDHSKKTFAEEFKALQGITQNMRDQTMTLTNSLKGNIKDQANLGEMILNNILDQVGLREGEDYIIQAKGEGIKDDEGRILKPDVLVKLPDNKHIIIDSKNPISNQIDYASESDLDKKEEYKKNTLRDLKKHVKDLSEKKYHSFVDNSPDFVLMFIPSEAVFSLAVGDSGLFEEAWDKKIVIVSPLTLYATLKTVASIWNIEKQNKNAQDIAQASGALYDKLVGFLEDMDKINSSIDKTRQSYDSAINKLKTGSGNVLGRIEKIKKLGAKANKELPSNFQDNH